MGKECLARGKRVKSHRRADPMVERRDLTVFLQHTLTHEPTDVVLDDWFHIGRADDADDNEPWMRVPMPFFGASDAAPPERDSVSDRNTLVGPTAQ